ncbi:hypothetical protein HY212_04390 [Candidatus Pacearchaeota archaeon]|nr:hypothetical protein [Candidatus Pacearchaeota archaeon]
MKKIYLSLFVVLIMTGTLISASHGSVQHRTSPVQWFSDGSAVPGS